MLASVKRVFCDETLCDWADWYRRFRGTCVEESHPPPGFDPRSLTACEFYVFSRDEHLIESKDKQFRSAFNVLLLCAINEHRLQNYKVFYPGKVRHSKMPYSCQSY